MISKIIVVILFATFYSPIFCDTHQYYQPRVPPTSSNSAITGNNENKYYEPVPSNSLATPRFGLWSPFEFLTLESLVQPAVTAIGVLVGIFGFLQITDFLLGLLALSKSKKITVVEAEKKNVEESNEVEAARRKRLISAEESERMLRSLDTASKAYDP